jgi:hypothetical protein
MKHSSRVILFVGVVVASGAGYFLGFDHGYEKAVEDEAAEALMAETHVDLPSRGGADWASYTNGEFKFQIEYRTQPDGYVLQEPEISRFASPSPRKALVLMQAKDFDELMQSTEPRDGPPAISIAVYSNEAEVSAEEWVRSQVTVSGFHAEEAALAPETVGGIEAVRYSADGLYQSDTVAISHGGYLFLLSGTYLEPESVIRSDFNRILETFVFLP